MTRRKRPINKTIASRALQKEDITLPGGLGTVKVAGSTREIESLFKGKDGATTLTMGAPFVFPNDLDRIQPEQINGNLTIKFPD